MPWRSVRALWQQHRASESECSKPPLFAAARGNQQKPAFMVPPKPRSVQSQKRWSVRECREWLDWCGVRHDDVFERHELIRRVEDSLTESLQSHSSSKDSRGAKYRPPQPEPIPMQPNARCPPREAAEDTCDTNESRRRTETWYSAHENASTPWDYCGCSYTGFAHHTTGTADDEGYWQANRPGTGEYRMPGEASSSPKTRAARAHGCNGARPAASDSKQKQKCKRKHNASDRTGHRHFAGAAFGEEKRDEAWARTVLGVRKTDGASTIKKRYYVLARKCHPDKIAAAASSGDSGARVAAATAKFQQIAAAYELLDAATA